MTFLRDFAGAVAGPFDSFFALCVLKPLHVHLLCAGAGALATSPEKHAAETRLICTKNSKRRWLHMLRSFAAFVVSSLLLSAAATAASDFNGDGRDDVLWRQANGQPMLWLMNGVAPPVRQPTGSAPGNNWLILGTGNFDGTGNDEILWLSSAGVPILWFLSNGQFSYSCGIANWTLAAGSTFIGLGDVDGDGKTDTLWLGADQTVSVKTSNGCSAGQTIAIGTAPAGASAVAVADFDGDGHADILGRTAAGQYVLWLLDGSGLRSAAALSPPIATGWQVAKVADFNADGRADLLWRLPDGSLTLSTMNGVVHSEFALTPIDADSIFRSSFEAAEMIVPSSSLPANWQVVDVGDFDGNGSPDILFADELGDTEVWLMSGTSIQSVKIFAPSPDMPYPGRTGWVLPLDRPVVTQVEGQVKVTWPALPAIANYTVQASAQNDPATTGSATAIVGTTLGYARNDPVYADKRYFSVSTQLWGMSTPPSPEAYLLEFDQINLDFVGPMTIADINGDGCIDILGALGDCHGGFSLVSDADMGLSALRANGRAWCDLRLADFNGDGIDDLIQNVYSWDVPYTNPTSHILLFWGQGNSQFIEDAAFSALNFGGYGETIVIADFDNDGRLDIFLPKYTAYDSSEHNYLLMNNGDSTFTEMSDSAGVAMRDTSIYLRPEGAQALDLDGDGRIDLYAGSHLFMNRTTQVGQPIFVDQRVDRGLPLQFDEGAKFIDWNNDGNLDLVLLHPTAGLQLWQNNGNSFHFTNVMPYMPYNQGYGMNAADLDGDGRPDLFIAGGCPPEFGSNNCLADGAPHLKAKLLLNRANGFVLSDFFDDGISDDTDRYLDDLQTFADFDNSGTLDVVSRRPSVDESGMQSDGFMQILMNRAASTRTIRVTVLGAAGEHNQFGRVVRVSPLAKPGFIMTDVVDGGSGYRSNGPYALQFAAPYMGAYRVDVELADRLVEVTAVAGQSLTIYANGDVSGGASLATVTTRPTIQ